ncbi:MAG: DUF5057 domain-containing protein [Lachnospiraceae bacterium]|nr:DUF5057 domain-containing protein [Lachnospiraceae bacterium]
MKNKKRKFAALALCVTLLVGLLATTFSSADDFNAPQDPIVLGGAEELTNIERIQSCYNSNLQTIVTNANLATGATSFKILEILPGEATTTIPSTTFSTYVESGMFASEVLTCDGVSVPGDKTPLTRVTASTLCAQGDGSKEAILEYLLSFDLVYVNNTDDYDKTGATPLTNVETDTANMFFETYDFSANGQEAFLEYVTSESAPLLMDYNIYKYLNPATLPGSSIIDPDDPINLKIAELAATDFPTKHFSPSALYSSDCHYVFPLNDNVLSGTEQIISYLGGSSNWGYPNYDNTPVLGTDDEGNAAIVSTTNYKLLEIVPQLPADGEKTPLQQLAEEEATVPETYIVTTTDDEGNEDYEYYYHNVTRLASVFLADDSLGGTIDVEICTPGSIPTDLSGYAAVFINIESADYTTLVTNDITESEKALLSAYASQGTGAKQYLYYEQSIGTTYNAEGNGNHSTLAVDYAYNIIKNIINTTTLQSKYSNVVLIDYLFLSDSGLDTAKISTIQAMINTAAYKGILPSSSDRKFNVLEIQPAAPVPYKNTDQYISGYYKGNNTSVSMEERVYSSGGKTYNFMFKPQGTINADGSFSYNGRMLGVYTDGNGGYYFARNTSQDFVVQESTALLVQSNTYADKAVNVSNASDLGIRPVYGSIQYSGDTFNFTRAQYSNGKYEVVYTNTSSSKKLFISKSEVWYQRSSGTVNVVSTFYDEMTAIGDPIKYVSYKASVGTDYVNDFFVYEEYKENVTLSDGVNPSGPFTLYVAPNSGYFLYEDAYGNLYVFNGYAKDMYNSEGGFSRVNYNIVTETGIYSYHITKSKIADLIGIDESKINIDNYTVSELNCKVDDLVNTYDLVVIGGDVSALREFKNNTSLSNSKYYRKMTVDNQHAYDMYFHTGDITLRDAPYYDTGATPGASNVLIGLQRNSNNKFVYVTSGMDLSYTKQQELYNYINSGRPVLIESEVINEQNNVSHRIDPVSYMGIMLNDISTKKNTGGYDNILTGFDYDDVKEVNGKTVYNDATKSLIVDTINSESSIIRPTLNIISEPIEYQDSLPKEAYAANGHKFSVEYNIGSEAGNNIDYEVNLYFDVDMDGRFSEEEIYNTQNYRTGVDKNKFMEYELVDTFFGILSWKLEATYTNAAGAITQVSQLGYAGYDKAADQIEELDVLQIVPIRWCNLEMCVKCDARNYAANDHEHEFGISKFDGTRNTGNWMDEFVFKDYFDINLEILTAEEFCHKAWDNSYAVASSVRNENWLIDTYDMIVIGFSDSYSNKDFTKVACAELIKFSEVNSLLCSHDNIGIVNSGARYNADAYGLGDGMADPDYHVRSMSTSWSYNMSHYYNPGDPIYDSSVRYVYGAARFFTLDAGDPYTNSMDGTEFYTDYGVNYGPSTSFMSGVYGGQTDACLGWRIGPETWRGSSIGYDTSPYKNDGYVGAYNNTQFARVTNDGIITRYPFALPERFRIDTTHAQYAQLDLDIESTTVWYCLDSSSSTEYVKSMTTRNEGLNRTPEVSYYTINPNDGRNSYYIYSNKNVTYTGAGHSEITPNYDNNYERKLFINTVFLSFNAMNNPPIINVSGDGIDTSDAAKINEPGTKVDAQAIVSSIGSVFQYDLKVIDDLPDRYFTGLIYVDANPNGEGYNSSEDTLLGIVKYGNATDGYIYYDLLKNGETRYMTALQLKQEYFDDVTDTTHISLQIFDRFPYSMTEVRAGQVSTVFTDQQSSKSLNSVYTIRIRTEGVIDMNLWELN